MNQTMEAENFENTSMMDTPNQMSVSALETQNALLQIRSRALTFCKNVVSSQGVWVLLLICRIPMNVLVFIFICDIS